MRSGFLANFTFLLLGVFSATAQESIQYGSISGRVEDATGAVVQNAKVTSRQKDTNITSTQLTDKDGRFRFPYLSVGEYEITVQHPGFSDAARTVNVGLGSAFELPITLTVAASSSQVSVESRADLLETARTQIAGTISQTEVNDLPLNGRNFSTWRCWCQASRPPIPPPTSFSPRPRLCPARGFPSAASGTSPTASSSTAVATTTMPPELTGAFIRSRRGERISGGHFRRPGGIRPRARRLHQRGHQERRQHAARRRLWIFPQQPFQCR